MKYFIVSWKETRDEFVADAVAAPTLQDAEKIRDYYKSKMPYWVFQIELFEGSLEEGLYQMQHHNFRPGRVPTDEKSYRLLYKNFTEGFYGQYD